MLRIYDVILDWISTVAPVIRAIAQVDRHLADQLRRCSTAVVLNVSEGMGASGGRKRAAYDVALGEMREAVGAIDLAVRLGYVKAFGEADADRQDRIVGTLVKLAHPKA